MNSTLPTSNRQEISDPFIPVITALDSVPAGSPAGMTAIAPLKAAWKFARAKTAELNRSLGGIAAGAYLTTHADRMLEILLNFSLKRAGITDATGIALVALGSYGRSELAPFSDIDMMLLHRENLPDAQLDVLVASLLHPMWDAGLHIGHSVRSPAECLKTMADSSDGSLETATSVLESRFVAGDSAFSNAFFNSVIPEFLTATDVLSSTPNSKKLCGAGRDNPCTALSPTSKTVQAHCAISNCPSGLTKPARFLATCRA